MMETPVPVQTGSRLTVSGSRFPVRFRSFLNDSEIVLPKLPLSLQIAVTKADGTTFVFDLKPEYVIWSRDGQGNAKVKRRGFRIIPDFAGTAHAYCGDTLDRCKGDLLEWNHTPTMDGMLRGLIIKSRVKRAEDFLLVRPYSPALFRQGAAPGPQMLLQRQQQKIKSEEELKKAWEAQKKQEKEKQALEPGPGYGRCNCPAEDALTKPQKSQS